jgi:hypothetical protein
VISVPASPSIINANVFAFDPAERLKPFAKQPSASLSFGIVGGTGYEGSDLSQAAGLLRTSRERPRGRSADDREKFSASHFDHRRKRATDRS